MIVLPSTGKTFEELLQENLELYVQEPEHSHHTFFQATREISLARYALSKQAEFYAKVVEIYTELMNRWLSSSMDDQKMLTNILHAINEIESKSAHLIESVRNVTALLGMAVNIDIDKAALSQMILRLPTLIKESIEKASNDPQLAERVSSSVDSKLSELMIACRFSTTSITPLAPQHPEGILQDEYYQMHNTIPSQPVLE